MQSYASEIEWLKSKVNDNPASMLFARLADRFLQVHDIDRAVEFAEKSVLLHPHYATASFVLAKCYFERRQFDEANKNLKKALAADPGHLAALKLMGELSRNLGDVHKAEENYARIAEQDPLETSIHKKIYDPQQPAQQQTGTLTDDWNLDLGKSTATGEPDYFAPDAIIGASADQATPAREEADLLENDPFADFEDATVAAREQTLRENEPFDFEVSEPAEEESEQLEFVEPESPAPVAPENAAPVFREEEVLDESIDDDFEIDRSKFKEEESKFTKLLDNIFSSSLDEEEQLEEEQRSTIERLAGDDYAADLDNIPPEDDESGYEPLMPPERGLSPEEKIIQRDRDRREDLYGYDADYGEGHSPDESGKRSEKPADNGPQTGGPARSQSTPTDFEDFLAGLDIREDTPGSTKKNKADNFDASLPPLRDEFSLADELDDYLSPTSSGDDWMKKFAREGDELSFPQDDSEEPPLDEEASDFYKSSSRPANEPKENKPGDKPDKHKGKFFTPTLGEIYAAQGQYAKAISVFETLIKNDPNNDWYLSKLEYLRKKLAEQQN